MDDLDVKPKGIDAHEPIGDFAVGQLWMDEPNNGTISAECVVVGVGHYSVAMAVLSATEGFLASDLMIPGGLIIRTRTFVWNYWRQLT